MAGSNAISIEKYAILSDTLFSMTMRKHSIEESLASASQMTGSFLACIEFKEQLKRARHGRARLLFAAPVRERRGFVSPCANSDFRSSCRAHLQAGIVD